ADTGELVYSRAKFRNAGQRNGRRSGGEPPCAGDSAEARCRRAESQRRSSRFRKRWSNRNRASRRRLRKNSQVTAAPALAILKRGHVEQLRTDRQPGTRGGIVVDLQPDPVSLGDQVGDSAFFCKARRFS